MSNEPSTGQDRPFVSEFENGTVMGVSGRLPALTMDLAEGYTLGTHIRMEIEVRVKGVRYEEDRRGNLVRQHIFAIETANLKSAFRPEDVRDDIGGSASANPTPEPVAGVLLGRSSDTWEATAPAPAPDIAEAGPEPSDATDLAEAEAEARAAIAWLLDQSTPVENADINDNIDEAVGF